MTQWSEDHIWVHVDDGMSVAVKVGTPHVDDEERTPWEPYGWHTFAWLPTKCRNGKWRWFRWLERHGKGDYTLGRGA